MKSKNTVATSMEQKNKNRNSAHLQPAVDRVNENISL